MKKTAIRKADQHETGLDIPALLKTRTFRELDNLGTAPSTDSVMLNTTTLQTAADNTDRGSPHQR